MPYFRKEVLSHYIGSGCLRQLRLYLTTDNRRVRTEREAEGMPPVQPPRPGLEQIVQEGERWGAEKVADLARTFGPSAVVGDAFTHASGQTRYREVALRDVLARAAAGAFLVEAQYEIGPAFEAGLGIADYRARF